MMHNLIFFLLFLSAVSCQLAFIWLHQHHFQCSQNTKSYREAVSHQYLCISSLTWTCIMDAIDYSSHSVISLGYFCGLINGQNAIQPHTIWNINFKPNIHVHFAQFSLSHNYWYCDYEYMKVLSNNKSNIFCGKRLPWIYDASDSLVTIIFSTRRLDSKYHQVELLYYGAYLEKYEHFLICIKPLSETNRHLFDLEQNQFESFHFISNHRMDILRLKALDVCNKHLVFCYDGPGIISPTVQCSYNQSEWTCLCSTFQMVCIFLSLNHSCTEVPPLYYYAIPAKEEDFDKMSFINFCKSDYKKGLPFSILTLDQTGRTGTTKYMAHPLKNFYPHSYLRVVIETTGIGSPYMLYEGHSCIYGGIYIMKPLLSGHSEERSHCATSSASSLTITVQNKDFVLVVVHYGGYSSRRIKLEADLHNSFHTKPLNITNKVNDTIKVTVPYKVVTTIFQVLYLKSSVLNLRKIHYFQFNFQRVDTVMNMRFNPESEEPCIYCTVSYVLHLSNMKGRQYDVQVSNKALEITDLIKSVFINTSTCDVYTIPIWSSSKTANIYPI